MQQTAHQAYSFDDFRLDLTRGCLYHESTELRLRPKSFEVLKYLLENPGRLVTKDELIEVVWRGMAVTDGSIVQCLKDIRNTLDDREQSYIRTIPRRGYIFDKEVVQILPVAIVTKETSALHLLIDHPSPPNGWTSADEKRTGLQTTLDPSITTRRRRGLIRGLKFALSGLSVGFVFLVVFQALLILGALSAQSQNDVAGISTSRATELAANLLVTVTLPVVAGWLTGIGLFLFGVVRMVYALFERDTSTLNPVMIERIIAVSISIVILMIAIPNMFASYRESMKRNKIKQPVTQQASN